MDFSNNYYLEKKLLEKKEQLIKANENNREIDEILYKKAKENTSVIISKILDDLFLLFDEAENHSDLLSMGIFYRNRVEGFIGKVFKYNTDYINEIKSYNKRHYLESISYGSYGDVRHYDKRLHILLPIFLDSVVNYFENLGFSVFKSYVNEVNGIVKKYEISITKENFGKLIMKESITDNLISMFVETKKEKEEIEELKENDVTAEINKQTDEAIKLLVQNQINEYKHYICISDIISRDSHFYLVKIIDHNIKTNEITLYHKANIYNKYNVGDKIKEFNFGDTKLLVFENKLLNILELLGHCNESYFSRDGNKVTYYFDIERKDLEQYVENPSILKLKMQG